jgi:hypothetical protein
MITIFECHKPMIIYLIEISYKSEVTFLVFVFLEARSCHVAQAGFHLLDSAIFLPQPPEVVGLQAHRCASLIFQNCSTEG